MTATLRLTLFVALLAFGAVLGQATPMYAWGPACSGRSELLCSTSEVETCTRRTVCSLSSLKVNCCAEKETIVDYYYWEAAN